MERWRLRDGKARAAEGFDSAAQAARRGSRHRPTGVGPAGDGGGGRGAGGEKGKVGFGLGSPKLAGCTVVGTGRVFSRVKGAEPYPRLLHGVADLGGKAAPWAAANAAAIDSY